MSGTTRTSNVEFPDEEVEEPMTADPVPSVVQGAASAVDAPHVTTTENIPTVSAITSVDSGKIEDDGMVEAIAEPALSIKLESSIKELDNDCTSTADKRTTEEAATTTVTTTTTLNVSSSSGTADTRTTNDRPWDFSNRKVIVQGVDKFHDVKTATKLLHKWLDNATTSSATTSPSAFLIDKIKKPPKSNWLLVTLQNESMVQPFIQFINSSNIKNRKGNNIFAKMQSHHNDDDESNTNHQNGDRRRRQRGEEENDNNVKSDGAVPGNNEDNDTNATSNKRLRRSNHDESGSTTTSIARRPITKEELYNKIIPLWNLSATEQAEYKMKEMIKKCAMKIIIDIKNKFRALEKEKSRSKVSIYPWILQQRCIGILPIITAPTPLRNKCELTFGYKYMLPANATASNTAECEVAPIEADNKVVVDDPNEIVKNPINDMEATKVPAVGFMVTGWAGGVSFLSSLPNIPYEVSMIVDIVNSFLLTSPLVPYDSTTHTGFWRILTIRTSRRTKECMIIIQHNNPPSEITPLAAIPAHSSYDSGHVTKETEALVDGNTIFAKERDRLVSLLVNADLLTSPSEAALPPITIKVTSIFFQEFSGLSNPPPEHPVQHVYGATYLTEQLGDCKFQISPGAFFQVNTEGAEILYELVVNKVREVSQPDPTRTLLFDVCCGTGTIGITCLKAGVVGQVVGVDISEPAINDANRNAILNGNTTNQLSVPQENAGHNPNTRFVASRAELVLGREIQEAKQRQRGNDVDIGTKANEMKFIAVVDPAREGLHADVVKAIRSNQRITRLVYVSCNPTATLVRDAALFCSPPTKRYTGRPFRITSAQPVDMFPLTNHCEMVMTFDRLTEEEM